MTENIHTFGIGDDTEPAKKVPAKPKAATTGAQKRKNSRALEIIRGETSAAALTLSLHGATDIEIARQLSLESPEAANRLWVGELARISPPAGAIETARNKALAQLNLLLASLAPRALSDTIKARDPLDPWGAEVTQFNEHHITYAKEFRAVLDRIIKLQGLDAPEQIDVHIPGVEEFNAIVTNLRTLTQGAGPAEGDIFGDYDEIDDDDESATAP